ncbi:MAG: class I SAM-dependent rRNA methyltransferase [Spirochaetaceae bacterium]|jgi:23S rRNA (cytosine1962-C5)-methyltransferase|nr:class I SAM-dependent rRNA methyltransferase [Spirochaetaceae bacterium]
MKRIILKAGEERRILAGHPWVYDNEVALVLDGRGRDASLEPGETADVESAGKTYLGRALANPHSKIIARIYSPSKEGIDRGFFKRRIRQALERRRGHDLALRSARLVFAEADFLPGLIIDRFAGWPFGKAEPLAAEAPLTFERALEALGPPESWIAIQFLAFGMDSRREDVIAALEEVAARELGGPPSGIIEKSGAPVRILEGLPKREGVMKGSFPPEGAVIFENGLPFLVMIEDGQKTGHFLDQKENRNLAATLMPENARVLDAFSYTGGFAVHALRSGARSACLVDLSAPALETARRNARLNGVEARIETVRADVFSFLRDLPRSRDALFDGIVLDPPAFAKSRAAMGDALKGYKEINLQALKRLRPGGILITCSCSQAVGEQTFKAVVADAALDAGRRLTELAFRYQAEDHPILVGYDESRYLKCLCFRAL